MILPSVFLIVMLAFATSATSMNCPGVEAIDLDDLQIMVDNTSHKIKLGGLLGEVSAGCIYSANIGGEEVMATMYREGNLNRDRRALQLMDITDQSKWKGYGARYIGAKKDTNGRLWLFRTKVSGIPIPEVLELRKHQAISKVSCVRLFQQFYADIGAATMNLARDYGILHTDPRLQNVLWDDRVATFVDFKNWKKLSDTSRTTASLLNISDFAQKNAKRWMDWETHDNQPGHCSVTSQEYANLVHNHHRRPSIPERPAH